MDFPWDDKLSEQLGCWSRGLREWGRWVGEGKITFIVQEYGGGGGVGQVMAESKYP